MYCKTPLLLEMSIVDCRLSIHDFSRCKILLMDTQLIADIGYCLWGKKFGLLQYSQRTEFFAMGMDPAWEGSITHACGIGDLVFVLCFHSYWFCFNSNTKVRNNYNIYKCICNNICLCATLFAVVRQSPPTRWENVVSLYREREKASLRH